MSGAAAASSCAQTSSRMKVPETRSESRAPFDPSCARSPFELCPTPKMYPSRVASTPLVAMSSNSRTTAWRHPSCCASTPNTSSMSRNRCSAAASSAVWGGRRAGTAYSVAVTADSTGPTPATSAHGATIKDALASRTTEPSITALRRKCAHAATYSANPRTVRSAASPSITTARPCTLNFSLPSMAILSSVSFTATFLNRESTNSAY
mmetsp:Transcript_10480/g.38851  ORF Transcript_10480/g.38851 Transcript_10480/m.38851 type:complete len:208 (+) Transcript_10480:275-898(+)